MMGSSETWSDKVKAFHNKYGVEDINVRHPIGVTEGLKIRTKIMAEEGKEFAEAWNELHEYAIVRTDLDITPVLEHVAKEGIDVIYTVIGTLLTLGVNVELAMQLVHDSNMSKEGKAGHKKITKGPNYKEPNMSVCI